MQTTLELFLHHEKDTLALGAKLARLIPSAFALYLNGELGAGKTTLIRGFLQQKQVEGSVKSPTYTLVEPYFSNDSPIYHFDLYRLANIEELEHIGIRDYFQKEAICLIEWADRAQKFLPPPDLSCDILIENSGRKVILRAMTAKGRQVLQKL